MSNMGNNDAHHTSQAKTLFQQGFFNIFTLVGVFQKLRLDLRRRLGVDIRWNQQKKLRF